jgi:hypothetical protein
MQFKKSPAPQKRSIKIIRFVKMKIMKSATFLTDKKRNREILQIDLKTLSKYPEEVEDLVDVIIAESRKNEKSISMEEAKKILKKAGKI